MKDFLDEIPCYTQVDRIIEIFENSELTGSAVQDIQILYSKLRREGFVTDDEMVALEAWIHDIQSIKGM